MPNNVHLKSDSTKNEKNYFVGLLLRIEAIKTLFKSVSFIFIFYYR